jgi:hypothetical protein
MEKQDRSRPTLSCAKCGEQARFVTNILDPKTGRTFLMYECKCGNKSWILDRS